MSSKSDLAVLKRLAELTTMTTEEEMIDPEAENAARNLLQGLQERGFVFKVDGETLRVQPPSGETLGAEERAAIKEHKQTLLALLADRPKFRFPIGWEQEWELERDIVRQQALNLFDLKKRKALLTMVARECQTEEEFTQWWRDMRELEIELFGKSEE